MLLSKVQRKLITKGGFSPFPPFLHRLKATGVIDVVNPVEQAMREGRLEELEDEGNQK